SSVCPPGRKLNALNGLSGRLDSQGIHPKMLFVNKFRQRGKKRLRGRRAQEPLQVSDLLLRRIQELQSFNPPLGWHSGDRRPQQPIHEHPGDLQSIALRFVGLLDGPQAEQIQKLSRMLLVRRDADEEIEFRPKRNAKSAAVSTP